MLRILNDLSLSKKLHTGQTLDIGHRSEEVRLCDIIIGLGEANEVH